MAFHLLTFALTMTLAFLVQAVPLSERDGEDKSIELDVFSDDQCSKNVGHYDMDGKGAWPYTVSPEPADHRIWKSVQLTRPLKAGTEEMFRIMGYAQPSDEHFADRPSECQNTVKEIMWNTSILGGHANCFQLPRDAWCFSYTPY